MSTVGKEFGPIKLPRARDLGPILVIWVICLGVLALENDFGTAILFFGLFVSMLYIATERFEWVGIGAVLLAGACLVAPMIPHVSQRIDTWLDPKPYFDGGCKINGVIHNQMAQGCAAHGGQYIADSGQLMRGLFSMGQGGVLGTGLGQGEPWRTPLSYSDFIFTSFGEELGLTGLMVILLAYALIVQRGMKAAIATKDNFAKLFMRRCFVRVRPAGLRDRRRRHAAHPADRSHHAVPRPGRFVAPRQLDPDRHLDPHQ